MSKWMYFSEGENTLVEWRKGILINRKSAGESLFWPVKTSLASVLPLSCFSPKLQARLGAAPQASMPAFPSTQRVGLTQVSPLLPPWYRGCSPTPPTPFLLQPVPLTAQLHCLPCHIWVSAETGQGHCSLLLDSLAGCHLSRSPRSWLLRQHAHDKLDPWTRSNE